MAQTERSAGEPTPSSWKAALMGSGTLVGNLFNAGILNAGNSPGSLAVSGNFAQAATGTLVAEIASRSAYAPLAVSGAANLDGHLRISLLNGFRPEIGDSFEILTAEDRVAGRFSDVEQPATVKFEIYYLANSVVVALIPADSLVAQSTKFGLYGTAKSGGFFANAIVGGGTNSYDMSRSIRFGSIDRTARGKPFGGEVDALLGSGYDMKLGTWTLSALGSLQYAYVGVQPFSETGAGSLDTRVGNLGANSIRCSLGGRVRYDWKCGEHLALSPELLLLRQHEFLDYAPVAAAWLDGGSGPQFDVAGEAAARNNVFAGAGISARIGERFGAYAFYNPEFGANIVSHSISAGLQFRF